MIKLEKQYITTNGDKSRLNFDFSIDGIQQKIWYEVESKYSQYLCTERCDAFVIGVLPYLLKNGKNLFSEIPITEELYFNLTEYLIPALVKYDKHYSMIKIDVTLENKILPCADGVGTGVSGGVDSFYSILQNYNSLYKDLKLTHLCIFNVGSFCGKHGFKNDIREKVIERGCEIAKEFQLQLIVTDSNLYDVFPRNHRCTHTFSSVFAVYCLGKLFKSYLYASSHDISKFCLINSSKNDCSKIDLITIKSFSIDRLKIISHGILKTRFEKTEFIADFPIVQKYLHVCTDEAENCNKCSKCMRTLLALDALKKLKYFKDVFDIEHYHKNKLKYYIYLFERQMAGDDYIEDVYKIIKSKISLFSFCFIASYVLIKNFVFSISYPDYNQYICIRIMGMNFKFRKK